MTRTLRLLLIVCLVACCSAKNTYISVDNIMDHLRALQAIADLNGGTRAAQSTGYNASVDYIVEQLKQTNYTVTVQPFSFSSVSQVSPPILEQVSPAQETYKQYVEYNLMTYTGSGDVTELIQTAGDGCQSSDFNGFVPGLIALVERGVCDFSTKVDNAVAAGAVGVIIYNYPGGGIFAGTLGSVKTVPVFAVSDTLAATWINSNPLPTLKMFADMEVTITYTANVIADTNTPGADESAVVIVGSHLDSVPAGPGINDNGSGSAANLEMALELFRNNVPLTNHVRFAWWAAEELGLLGSEYYVSQAIASGEINNIALNLNFDMIGSPNYYRGVYDGEGASEDIRTGSVKIDELFTSYFGFEGLAWNYTAFDGRSDYGPFIANGVPAGGLFTGAEVVKSPDWRKYYGGIANAAFDTCYHLACDDIYNINEPVLSENAHAAYFVTIQLAQQENLLSWLTTPDSKLHNKPHRNPVHSTSKSSPHFTKA